MSNVDLHMHSIYSDDGEFTVKELFKLAKEANLNLMSITDHDTVEANFEAVEIADLYGITYLPGIEVSCQFNDIDLHVIGYNIDYTDPIWDKRYHNLVNAYNSTFYQIIELLNAFLGVSIDADQLLSEADGKMVNGEAVCAYLLKDQANINNPLLRPYFPGGDRSDMPLVNFYWDLMSQGKVAYVPLKDSTTLVEAIKMIKDAGGFAVLAHPGQNLGGKEQLLPEILKCGITGIEVYTSYHNPQQIAYYHQKAIENDCLITCGSDFHGAIKPIIKMGKHHGDIQFTDFMNELKQRKLI